LPSSAVMQNFSMSLGLDHLLCPMTAASCEQDSCVSDVNLGMMFP
jgi:hypothetical protein